MTCTATLPIVEAGRAHQAARPRQQRAPRTRRPTRAGRCRSARRGRRGRPRTAARRRRRGRRRRRRSGRPGRARPARAGRRATASRPSSGRRTRGRRRRRRPGAVRSWVSSDAGRRRSRPQARGASTPLRRSSRSSRVVTLNACGSPSTTMTRRAAQLDQAGVVGGRRRRWRGRDAAPPAGSPAGSGPPAAHGRGVAGRRRPVGVDPLDRVDHGQCRAPRRPRRPHRRDDRARTRPAA